MEIPHPKTQTAIYTTGAFTGSAVYAITAKQHVTNSISISSAEILPG